MSQMVRDRPRGPVLTGAGVVYALVTIVTTVLWLLDAGGWLLLPFDLFSFWWPLPAFVLLGLAIWRGRRRAAALLLLPVVYWATVHGGAFLPRSATVDGDLTVLSLNVLLSTESTDQLRALIDEHDPDVVLLQEIFPDRMEQIREVFGDRYPHVEATDSAGVGGVALLSKHPIDSSVEVAKPHERARGTFVATIDGVQYVPVHLTSPCPACGSSLHERLAGEDAARHLEMEAVLDALDPALPAVVGGDFNSTARGDPYRLLAEADFRDPHRERGWGPGFTWSTRMPIEVIRIDWVLVRGLEPTSSTVGAAGGSDHRPVIVEVRREDG